MKNQTRITTDGQQDTSPGRRAITGVRSSPDPDGVRKGQQRRGHRDEFTSYYGKPVLNGPTWEARDIAGYLFLGGLAGASSVVGAVAQLTGRPALARTAKIGASGAIGLSLVALVHDLGRPARFLNMLRVVKPSSPMNMGSWLIATYAPAAMMSALSSTTGWLPLAGNAGTAAASLLGPGVAAYTAVLLADTAVPAWHDGRAHMPWVFVSSAAASAAGLGLLGAPLSQVSPVRRLAIAGGGAELVLTKLMEKKMGPVGEVYSVGDAGRLLHAATAATAGGVIGAAVFGGRNRAGSAAAGLALLAGAALTRFGIFQAGLASAEDPQYTVDPQRKRKAQSSAGDPSPP